MLINEYIVLLYSNYQISNLEFWVMFFIYSNTTSFFLAIDHSAACQRKLGNHPSQKSIMTKGIPWLDYQSKVLWETIVGSGLHPLPQLLRSQDLCRHHPWGYLSSLWLYVCLLWWLQQASLWLWYIQAIYHYYIYLLVVIF